MALAIERRRAGRFAPTQRLADANTTVAVRIAVILLVISFSISIFPARRGRG